MRVAILGLLVVCAVPQRVWGMWGFVPLEKLVGGSDFVVVGTLTDVVEFSVLMNDYGRGVITVDEVLWGRMAPGQKLVLAWRNDSSVLCPRIEHGYCQNTRGIWLLTFTDTGHVRADYPGRFVDLSRKEEVLALLAGRSGEEAKEYVQIAPVQELLAADRPYVHQVVAGVIGAVFLGAILWWLARTVRKRKGTHAAAGELEGMPRCPYCQSPFELTWRRFLLSGLRRYRCPDCGKRMKLRCRWRDQWRQQVLMLLGTVTGVIALPYAFAIWFGLKWAVLGLVGAWMLIPSAMNKYAYAHWSQAVPLDDP